VITFKCCPKNFCLYYSMERPDWLTDSLPSGPMIRLCVMCFKLGRPVRTCRGEMRIVIKALQHFEAAQHQAQTECSLHSTLAAAGQAANTLINYAVQTRCGHLQRINSRAEASFVAAHHGELQLGVQGFEHRFHAEARQIQSREVESSKDRTMASSSSACSDLSTASTPHWPPSVRPHSTGRPSSTASAPSASACGFQGSWVSCNRLYKFCSTGCPSSTASAPSASACGFKSYRYHAPKV